MLERKCKKDVFLAPLEKIRRVISVKKTLEKYLLQQSGIGKLTDLKILNRFSLKKLDNIDSEKDEIMGETK